MTENKLRVAVYSGDIPSTTFIENLIEVLSGDGFEIYLFGKKRKEVKYRSNVKLFPTPEKGILLILFAIKEMLILLLKDFSLLKKCIKIISDKKINFKSFVKNLGFILPILNNQPDIFHIQWAKTVKNNPEIFDLLDSKIVLSLRGAHINYSPINDLNLKRAYLKYFPKISGFHAVSKAIAKEAVKYGAEENKIRVIHSSVNNELLKYAPDFRAGQKIPDIISIGRHHWKKGYNYAFDAMFLLKKENVKFNYTIIAQGDLPEELLYLIKEYNLEEEVKISGGMNFDELTKRLLKSDLLLLPSVEEGIANVVLEAMAIGIPVITTNCGGMEEAVTDGINGFMVSVRDPVSIKNKIIDYLNISGEQKMNLILNAKATIQKEFSTELQKTKFRKFYESIAGQ